VPIRDPGFSTDCVPPTRLCQGARYLLKVYRSSAGASTPQVSGGVEKPTAEAGCRTRFKRVNSWPMVLRFSLRIDIAWAFARTPGLQVAIPSGMRTLHSAYRVTDLDASLAFYAALGYDQVGRVDLGDGMTLTMLKFPNDDVVTLELAHRPADGPVVIGSGFSHLAVQVDNLGITLEAVTKAGLSPGPVERPGGLDGPQTSWLADPDGYRIELVQWPPGHAYGLTTADFG
jgi:lactoylglutathione lyase